MTGRGIESLTSTGKRDIIDALNHNIEGNDLFIFNLESPLDNNAVSSGIMDLTASPGFLDMFTNKTIIAATLANNHSLDNDSIGLLQTQEIMNSSGNVGVLPYPASVHIDLDGQQVLLSSYNALQYDTQEIEGYLAWLKSSCKDIFCIVSIHWGKEYVVSPGSDQRMLAEQIAQAGVEFILGHHPHVLQPVEWIETGKGKTLVAYSMGNLVFDMTLPDARRTGLLVIEIKDNEILDVCAIPLVLSPGSWLLREPEPAERTAILDRLGIPQCDN